MKSILLTAALVTTSSAQTALTIYNQNLAVVRETVPLELKAGENVITFDRATAQVLPASVVLRDPAGQTAFSILEQGYRNDPVSKWLLLSRFEGQTINFRTVYPDGKVEIKQGKIIRSGYVPGGPPQEPIIEVDDFLRFELPGEPLFPALGDGSILRPTLEWTIRSEAEAAFPAQLSYLSQGFQWEADYNFVAPEKGETVALTGWVTVQNHSGTGFNDAQVKLIAGDVNVIQEVVTRAASMNRMKMDRAEPAVQEKAFDDFHLYTLQRPLTIRDKETKQVEFLRAPEVKAVKKYLYDAAAMQIFGGAEPQTHPIEGVEYPKDVAIYWEFINSPENGLGVPLPKGRVRFYRADEQGGGNLEFVGENNVDHTPRGEEISLYTGNAFDLVGERKITNFQRDERENRMKETIEITLRNRSQEPKEVTVREHLWRWFNWKIENATIEAEKKDAQKIEFKVSLAPNEEKTLTYTAHYSW